MFSQKCTKPKQNDADLLIVQTAVASAETVVVGHGTDIVCQSCQNVNFRVFFKPKEEKRAQLPFGGHF